MVKNQAIQSISQDPALFDNLDHLAINNVDVPEPGEGEVLVRMKLWPVNPVDIMESQGLLGAKGTFTVGSEGLAVVDKLGPGATTLKVGQRVVAGGWPAGTWQQYLVAPASQLLVVPDAVDDKTAAQFYINPATVVGLVRVSGVQKGGWLLQTAAGSVLGRQLVQYAKHLGIKTINVVRRQEHVDELKALGADEVINSKNEDIVERVIEITGGKGADAALDPVGGEMTATVLSAVKAGGGSVIVFGTISGPKAGPVDTRDLFFGRVVKGFNVYGYLPALGPQEVRRMLEAILQLLADGVITPSTAGRVFPMDQFKEACKESAKTGSGAKVFLEG